MDAHPNHSIAPPLAPDALVALQAVAEPTRARIIALLGHGEHCVCDVGEMLGVSTALVSHHVRTLRASGLLHERRMGRWVYYSLDLDRLASLRVAVADMLTPTEAAATACQCSDCGTRTKRVQLCERPIDVGQALLDDTPETLLEAAAGLLEGHIRERLHLDEGKPEDPGPADEPEAPEILPAVQAIAGRGPAAAGSNPACS